MCEFSTLEIGNKKKKQKVLRLNILKLNYSVSLSIIFPRFKDLFSVHQSQVSHQFLYELILFFYKTYL